MAAQLASPGGRESRVDDRGMSWVNLMDGTIHARCEVFDENWAVIVGYEGRVADFAASEWAVEIVPLPWTGQWGVRFVISSEYSAQPERRYLGYPEDTHIKLFESWEEARDRMRACGFSYARMSVVMPVHLASRLLGAAP